MRKSAVVASLGVSLAAASPAVAQSVLYQTGFEAPTFTAGFPLVGQDSWAGVSFLNPNAAIIATDQPFAGKQAVRVRGADLVPSSTVNFVSSGYYAAVGSYRRNVDFDVAAAGFPIVRVQAAVRVDGNQACAQPVPLACSNFFSASVTGRAVSIVEGSTIGIGELAISSDGKAYGYSGNDFVPGCPSPPGQPAPPSCVASFLVTAPVSLGEYHTLAVNTDFAQQKFAFCLDGSFLAGPFPFPPDVDTNILRRGSVVTYARPDTPQLHKTSFKAHYDNFSITTLAASQTVLSCD